MQLHIRGYTKAGERTLRIRQFVFRYSCPVKVKPLMETILRVIDTGNGSETRKTSIFGVAVDDTPTASNCDNAMFDACGLGYEHRFYAALGFFGLGLLEMFMASLYWSSPTLFATCYSLSNLSTFGSGWMIWGPCSSVKSMCQPNRAPIAILYVGCIALTLWLAFSRQSWYWIILAVLSQAILSTLLFLSYVPGALSLLRHLLCKR